MSIRPWRGMIDIYSWRIDIYSWRGLLLYSAMVKLTSTHDEVYCYTALWSDSHLLMTRCTARVDVNHTSSWVDVNPTSMWSKKQMKLHILNSCRHTILQKKSCWVFENVHAYTLYDEVYCYTALWSNWHLLMTRCTVIQRYGRIHIYSWRGVLLYSVMVGLTSTHDEVYCYTALWSNWHLLTILQKKSCWVFENVHAYTLFNLDFHISYILTIC
jgi:hypothetical protein